MAEFESEAVGKFRANVPCVIVGEFGPPATPGQRQRRGVRGPPPPRGRWPRPPGSRRGQRRRARRSPPRPP
eukprot:11167027-Lingulodinium_polyedra.AAC.1